MLITNLLVGDYLLLIVILLITIIIVQIKWSLNYWQRLNIKSVKFPVLNLTRSQFYKDKDYRYFKSIGEKVYGVYIYLKPTLILIDPEVIKHIFIKDFHVFNSRGIHYDPANDPISNHLLFMSGNEWKKMRAKLTPVFTSGKIKLMFDIILRCSDMFLDGISRNLNDIDIKDSLGCFMTDVIGSCAFGTEMNTLNDPNSKFRYYGKKVFETLASNMPKRIFINTYPKFASRLGFSMENKEITNFFFGFVKNVIEYRERNNYRRNDFLQILIDLKNSDKEEERLTITEITAQCYIFFLAGFETSSSTLTFALYELAKNKDIQDKVREEIKTVLSKHDGDITYESLKQMKYIGQVLDETLRMYPVTHTIRRKCERDYVIPNTNMVIEKNMIVILPLLSIHRNDEYYPEPEKFDPERFNEINKGMIPSNVYMPFGDGPRICIGMRFGVMQSKIALVNLLRNYELTVSKKTKPLVLDSRTFTTSTVDPIYLNAKQIS